MVEDPLCHKLVPKQQAVQLEIKGETYYFCSKECSEQFLSEKGEES
ncbi:MAG: YHS domain-containing protein [Desulfofustis sp.]|nr:YHS domain-containing protein [Desulfofustis sp.]